jgi:hypothetical protein
MTTSEQRASIGKQVRDAAVQHSEEAMKTDKGNIARMTGYYGSYLALLAMADILDKTARDMAADKVSP